MSRSPLDEPLAIALALLLALAPTRARADEARAREHAKRGISHLYLDRYDAAVAEFTAAFEEDPQPEYLERIAQAHERAGRPPLARSFYRKYLELAPAAPDRADVERHLAALDHPGPAATANPPPATASPPAATANEEPAAGADTWNNPPPRSAATPAPATANPPAATASPPAATAPPPATTATPAAVATATQPAAAGAPSKKWPLWLALGAGVIVVGAAIGIGVAVAQPQETLLPPESLR